MSLPYNRLLNIVDSLETFESLTNKPDCLFIVKDGNDYLLYFGNNFITTKSSIDAATSEKIGGIISNEYISVDNDGTPRVLIADKLSNKNLKIGDAYFDGSENISLKDMGALSTDDTFEKIVTIPLSFSNTAPYVETINVDDILESHHVIITPIYDSDVEIALEQKRAWNCIDEIETQDGSIIVKCFSTIPSVEIDVQMKVVI